MSWHVCVSRRMFLNWFSYFTWGWNSTWWSVLTSSADSNHVQWFQVIPQYLNIAESTLWIFYCFSIIFHIFYRFQVIFSDWFFNLFLVFNLVYKFMWFYGIPRIPMTRNQLFPLDFFKNRLIQKRPLIKWTHWSSNK